MISGNTMHKNVIPHIQPGWCMDAARTIHAWRCCFSPAEYLGLCLLMLVASSTELQEPAVCHSLLPINWPHITET
jgi:hypothetical protein